ncbi:MAG: HD domain-containing protein [Ruminococcus sp.]|nr:HD domain-containing protein [Ruminococcus sp.]
MIYTELTIKAMKLAYTAHHGQTDKTGVPYIFHPFHVAEQMNDEYSTCAALLHDIVEDTDITIARLEGEFPPEVTEAVKALTHEEGVDYIEYLRQIAENPIAKAVKLADIAHNSDQTRLAAGGTVSAAEAERLRKKYETAKSILSGKK